MMIKFILVFTILFTGPVHCIMFTVVGSGNIETIQFVPKYWPTSIQFLSKSHLEAMFSVFISKKCVLWTITLNGSW